MDEFQGKLLNAAIRAPSGDNCQPWRFDFTSDKSLNIYIEPKEASSVFDLDYRATYISIGAVIENIEIIANNLGFEIKYQFLGEIEANIPVVEINFEEMALLKSQNENMLAALFRRTVNRRPFLPFGVREIDWISLVDLQLPENVRLEKYAGKNKALWRKAIKLADVIRWSEKSIHKELFEKIRLSEAEALKTRTGLEIDRLGAGPGGSVLMRLLSSWSRFKWLKKVGFVQILASQTQFLVSASAGIIGIWVKLDTPSDWISGGKVMQAMWNKAEMLGLAVQPLPVCLYLNRRNKLDKIQAFEMNWSDNFAEIDRVINHFKDKDASCNKCIMIFRVGKALPMKQTAIRKRSESFIYKQ